MSIRRPSLRVFSVPISRGVSCTRTKVTTPLPTTTDHEVIKYQLASRNSRIIPDRVDRYLSRKDDDLSDEDLMSRLTSPTAQSQLSMYKSSLPSLTSSTFKEPSIADDLIPRPSFHGRHDEKLRGEWVKPSQAYRNLPYPVLFFEKLALLERKLEIKFENRVLLIQAMITQSHSYGLQKDNETWASLSNERLEFLGDMIIHFLTTCFLLRHFPYSRPNIPHAYRSKMCMNSLLGKVAIEKFQLHELLVVRNPIRADQVTNVCSNTLEALTAAIYLDQGMTKTTEFFNRFLLKDLFAEVSKTKPLIRSASRPYR